MFERTEGLLHVTSTVADGNMSFRFGDAETVTANRRAFLQKNGIDFENHICMQCNHGSIIKNVSFEKSAEYLAATSGDAMLSAEVLVTRSKGLALMLLTADCLPTTLYDPTTKTLALAHFSRQTIADMLPQKTIGFLRETYNVNPAHLVVTVGPHIHARSYAFPLPLQNVAPAIKPFVHKVNEHAYIDLSAALKQQLTKRGVLIENISLNTHDTAISPDYFSHYVHKKTGVPDARMATIAVLRA